MKALFHIEKRNIILSLSASIIDQGRNYLLKLHRELLVPLVLKLLWDENSLSLFMEFGESRYQGGSHNHNSVPTM